MDQWLWAVRLFKTRSLATAACRGGHVKVNGKAAKPATPVHVGDRVTAHVAERDRVVEVVQLIHKRVAAPVAAECLVDHSPPAPPREYVEPLFPRPAAAAGRRRRTAAASTACATADRPVPSGARRCLRSATVLDTSPLAGRIAFVTGAARGIGRAIALALAEAGADVAVADVHPEPFEGERYYRLRARVSGPEEAIPTAGAVVELGRRAMSLGVDVADADAVVDAVAACTAELGPPDILVNNAGIVNNIAPHQRR